MKKIKALLLFTMFGFMLFVGYGSIIGSSSEVKLPYIQADYFGGESRDVVTTTETTTTTTTTSGSSSMLSPQPIKTIGEVNLR